MKSGISSETQKHDLEKAMEWHSDLVGKIEVIEITPPDSKYMERLEMLKAMDCDNDPTATTHLHQ